MIVVLYLASIAAANVLAAGFPAWTPLIALVFIGFDLTARDRLHDRWQGRTLWLRMLLLIVAGGLLSWLISGAAGRVALASCIAFIVSGVADALIYHLLRGRSRQARINGSNVAGALIDSLLFLPLAFGVVGPLTMLLQFVAKVAGGWLWSLALRRNQV